MQKKIFIHTYLVMASICAMTFTACTNSSDVASESAATAPLQLSVLDNATRSAITTTTLPDGCDYGIFVVDSSSLATLSNGNNVGVSYSSQYSKLYNPVLLSDQKDYVYAYYPYSSGQSLKKLTIETNSQTDYLYGMAVDGSKKMTTVNNANPKANILFKHAMARLVFNITQDASDTESNKITRITVEKVPTGYAYDMTTQKLTATTTGSVAADCNITASTTTQPVDLLVLPVSGQDLSIGFYINDKWIYKSLSSVKWAMGQQYTYTVNISNDKMVISDPTITPRTNYDESSINMNGEVNLAIGGTVGNAVDLGLSVKWADHNVGATKPEDYGGLYGWGDPTGLKTTSTDSEYPSSEKYASICSTDFDIAHIQWKGNWRLPTMSELDELHANCTFKWTTRNGIYGMLVTSNKAGYTGNSIFLPAAGYRSNLQISSRDSGRYWSGTSYNVSSLEPIFSYATTFTSNFYNLSWTYGNHGNGLSVRPVCNK